MFFLISRLISSISRSELSFQEEFDLGVATLYPGEMAQQLKMDNMAKWHPHPNESNNATFFTGYEFLIENRESGHGREFGGAQSK